MSEERDRDRSRRNRDRGRDRDRDRSRRDDDRDRSRRDRSRRGGGSLQRIRDVEDPGDRGARLARRHLADDDFNDSERREVTRIAENMRVTDGARFFEAYTREF